MTRLTLLFGAAALTSFANALLVDDFTSGFASVATTDDAYYTSTGGFSGFRYVQHGILGNPRNRNVLTELSAAESGSFFVETGSNINSMVYLVYTAGLDAGVANTGPGNVPRGDFKPLAPLDFTGKTSLRVTYSGNDQPSTFFTYEIWAGDGNPSFGGFVNAAPGDGFVDLDLSTIPVSVLGSVTGISLGVYLPNGNDVTLNRLEVIPEPATLLMLAAGAGLFAARRRRS